VRLAGLRAEFREALALLDTLVQADVYEEFLTTPGYQRLE
jgi:hypothetical protein